MLWDKDKELASLEISDSLEISIGVSGTLDEPSHRLEAGSNSPGG